MDATGSVVVVKYVYGSHGNHCNMSMLITDRHSDRSEWRYLFKALLAVGAILCYFYQSQLEAIRIYY